MQLELQIHLPLANFLILDKYFINLRGMKRSSERSWLICLSVYLRTPQRRVYRLQEGILGLIPFSFSFELSSISTLDFLAYCLAVLPTCQSWILLNTVGVHKHIQRMIQNFTTIIFFLDY